MGWIPFQFYHGTVLFQFPGSSVLRRNPQSREFIGCCNRSLHFFFCSGAFNNYNPRFIIVQCSALSLTERNMSLVDYASSSSEDEGEEEQLKDQLRKQEEEEETHKDDKPQEALPTTAPNVSHNNQNSMSSLQRQSNTASPLSLNSIEKLPDASVLLSSSDFSSHQMSNTNHSSRVAAAMAESRKRESNGSGLSYPRSKHPRGNLPHSRNVPDTVGNLLVPPQLSGRSNVVTEDIGKLFIKKGGSPSSQ